MVGLKIATVIIVVACGANVSAAVYYVDQAGGSDRNKGNSPGAPWKNCPGMVSYAGKGALKPGDTVYFNSAGTWPVTGPQGLYLVGGVTYIGDSWGKGTRAEIRADGALEAGVIRFRDHVAYETVFKGFNVNANNQVATGIDINHRYGSLMTGATKRVQNCEVHHVRSRKSLGQYKYGIIISNHAGSSGHVENVEILDCAVHDISRDAICLYPGDEDADCRIRNITVRGCEVYNTGQDPEYGAGAGIAVKGHVVDAFLENNHVHDVRGAGIFVNGNETNHYGVGPTNIHIRNNIVDNPNSHGGILLYDKGTDPKDIKIYGNIILNNAGVGGLTLLHNSGPLDLLVYNNTFYNASVRFTHHTSTVNTLEFKNNIVYCTSGVPLIADSGTMKQHSNNIYFRGDGVLVMIGDAAYTSRDLAAFEASASGGDPMFKDTGDLPTGFRGTHGKTVAPNRDGLSLRQASPGVGRGIALGSAYATSINSLARPAGGGWDIGAYEHRR